MIPQMIAKYVEKATPSPERGDLNFTYVLDQQTIADEAKSRARTKQNSMRALALAGGRSPISIIERAIAGELVGKGKDLIKESFYHGFIEEIRTISSGHPLRR